MTDQVNSALVDLNTITEFQKTLHETDENDEDDKLESRFHHRIKKCSWSTHIPEVLKYSPSDNGGVDYKINTKFQYLRYTYMKIKLPHIKVKEECKDRIQICWPYNIGLNVVNSASWKIDDCVIQKIDSVWNNINAQFFRKADKTGHYNNMIGNVGFLQAWSNELVPYSLVVPQCWSYCKDNVQAIPLYLASSSKIEHFYDFKLKYSDLIRMRLKKDTPEGEVEEWIETEYQYKFIEKMVSGNEQLEYPDLWGRYVKTTEDEETSMKEFYQENECEYYIEDVVSLDSENSSALGSNVPIDIQCSNPCKAIFWVAENVESTSLRNLSNYTTNIHDINGGWNPISEVKLTYNSTDVRLSNMSSEHFDRAEAYFNFPSTPYQPGYNCYSFAYDLTSIDADIGIVFGEKLRARLNLKLSDTNPHNTKAIEENIALNEGNINSIFEKMLDKTTNKSSKLQNSSISESKAQDTNFKIHIRLLVLKKLKFEGYKGFIETTVNKVSDIDSRLVNLPSPHPISGSPPRLNNGAQR